MKLWILIFSNIFNYTPTDTRLAIAYKIPKGGVKYFIRNVFSSFPFNSKVTLNIFPQ